MSTPNQLIRWRVPNDRSVLFLEELEVLRDEGIDIVIKIDLLCLFVFSGLLTTRPQFMRYRNYVANTMPSLVI